MEMEKHNDQQQWDAGQEEADASALAITRRSFVKTSAVGAAMLLAAGTPLAALAGCAGEAPLAETSAPVMTFRNITEQLDGRLEADIISMTEARRFRVTVPRLGQTLEEVQALLDDGRVGWTLSREVGAQDNELFPYQQLGGELGTWKTVATEIQPQKDLFSVIEARAVEIDGEATIEMTFESAMLFGYDGIDTRDHKLVRNSILDYTGTYDLACVIDGEAVDTVAVDIRPYDYYLTQAEIDASLPELAEAIVANGFHAEVQTIGQSADGRDVRAVFVAKSAQDLDDYRALVERAETDPAAVQDEVRAGSLSYKVPIVYSNIHPDETVGSDGVLEFLRLLAASEPVEYFAIAGLTDEGRRVLAEEMGADRVVWSDLIDGKVTGVGYIQGNGERNPTRLSTDPHTGTENPDMAVNLSDEEFAAYYDVETRAFSPADVLDDVFFILVPAENPDGRAYNVRVNGNGFDLNRDNTYQTQPETQAMTSLIAAWNPIALYEIHGYWTQYQVEPCSPAHDPNNEYDLFIDTALEQGEAYIAASIANNVSINGAQIPMRDYLKRQEDGSTYWEVPFDDMTSSYTPQYAMLHGANAYTVETPFGSQDAVDAVVYGFVGNAQFVADNKDRMFLNQLERFRRGVENIDADELRPWYVSQKDEHGADAEVFRPRYAENNNFFPEYYVIPFDQPSQRDRAAARDAVDYLIRNGVQVLHLDEPVELGANEHRGALSFGSGSVVVPMRQAKRNMANAALYSNLVLDSWTELYSEPVTNFPAFRGFDACAVATPGAFDGRALSALAAAPDTASVLTGEGEVVVVANNGLEALRAVNFLLGDGASVGLATEGDYAGDYVMSAETFSRVADDYVLDAEAIATMPVAQRIKNGIKVYVPGRKAEFMEDAEGRPFGVRDYETRMKFSYNWDRFALAEQMGFTLASTAEEADVMVGNGALTAEEGALAAAGKPYVGYGMDALASAADAGLDIAFDATADGLYDALTTVDFPAESLVTAAYARRDDRLMYGHDGTFITGVPADADVLIRLTDDDFTEGFMAAEHIAKYRGSVQAVDCQRGAWNTTLFANSLTNKAHQVHEYRLLATAVYSRMLDESFDLA